MLSRVSSQLHKCLIIIFFTASYLQIFSWARLAFHCPLCVWQVKRGGAGGWGRVGIRVKKTRILTADWKQCSSGSHSTSLIRPPEASLLLSHPSCVTGPAPHTEQSLSHTPVSPPSRQVCHQKLWSWPASLGSWDKLWLHGSHTEDREQSGGNKRKWMPLTSLC